MTTSEPRNPLYLLLLLVSLVFVITALAYAVVPVLEQQSLEAGVVPPPSLLREALRQNGGRWLLYEVAVMLVVAVASMALDRWRQGRTDDRAPVPAPRAVPPSLPGPAGERRSAAEPHSKT